MSARYDVLIVGGGRVPTTPPLLDRLGVHAARVVALPA
jgi:hypothetical protein